MTKQRPQEFCSCQEWEAQFQSVGRAVARANVARAALSRDGVSCPDVYGKAVNCCKMSFRSVATSVPQRFGHGVSHLADRMNRGLGEEQGCFIKGCPRDWEALPEPAAPLAIGIDRGYVHSRDQTSRQSGWFEVIVRQEHTVRVRRELFWIGSTVRPKAQSPVIRVTQIPVHADESGGDVLVGWR